MISLYFYELLIFVPWIFFHTTHCFEEVPLDEKKQNVNSTNDEKEIEDVFDDYMKVIIFDGLQFRSAVQNTDKIWEDGIVPYEISDNYSNENKNFILRAMEEFSSKTCIQFHERTKEDTYITLIPGSGCSAVVGKVPNNGNRITLHKNCFVKGIVFHELMHALGFIHEQNRPDRDEFVRVIFENIKSGSKRNFHKYSVDEVQMFNHSYDYGSVMHYGTNDFAINRSRPTIIPLRKGVSIGQRQGFSKEDLIRINLLYNCTGAKENSTKDTDDSKEISKEDNVERKVAKEEDNDDSKRKSYRFRKPDDLKDFYDDDYSDKIIMNKDRKNIWFYIAKT